MAESEFAFHFSQPWWLLALLLILPVSAWLRRSSVHSRQARINRYADRHLMPYLTGSRELRPRERRRRLTRWAILWSLLVIAMAGPRWDHTEVRLYTPGASLVILLDISRSMEVTDVTPNRIARARQEIDDLLDLNPGIRVGLIAFASVAHVVTPITEDSATLRNLLPHLTSDLARLQGSRLDEALRRAELLLAAEPAESSQAILLISDGDFPSQDYPELLTQVAALAAQGITLHTLGVGTAAGGPVPAANGGWLTDPQRNLIQSRLDPRQLQQLADAGHGIYRLADFRSDDVAAILDQILHSGASQQLRPESALVWNERYFWLLIPVLLLLLGQFRRVRSLEERPQS